MEKRACPCTGPINVKEKARGAAIPYIHLYIHIHLEQRTRGQNEIRPSAEQNMPSDKLFSYENE